ncbi:MAG: DUF4159 domain-containing protein [Acidimicrobiia bacterium]|nr:DUF4159 domain-containing protein [Acidimicrobiia bacterium]
MRRLPQLGSLRTSSVTSIACGLILAGTLLAATAHAQRWFRYEPRLAGPDSFDGRFNFCRVMYRTGRFGGGGGWSADYPSADVNLSMRLSELTKTSVSRSASGYPNHLVVRLTDDELFQCPFLLMAEVGGAYFDETEAARLREHLTKGGFLWVDDFWGSWAWDHWVNELAKALPAHQFPVVDVPPDHPLYRTMFSLPRIPQIPSINHWLGSGGGTSERGADSADVHTRAVFDTDGRIMVLMTHNTDISDSWEREGEDPNYFYEFSVDGYAVAVNVLMYAMTH